MAQKSFGLERYIAEQSSNKSGGYVPVVQGNTQTVPFLLGSRGFLGGVLGIDHGEANNKYNNTTTNNKFMYVKTLTATCLEPPLLNGIPS